MSRASVVAKYEELKAELDGINNKSAKIDILEKLKQKIMREVRLAKEAYKAGPDPTNISDLKEDYVASYGGKQFKVDGSTGGLTKI